ncbi:uncharacterized protein LOC134215721 isoform X2 [Armigeres subalbatus]|uniref:uncharacterized protein LOC134215721 isoform X2 n=1 Tax=Armigeres subalbatus TaxID=124917 RepID=UPI002ED41A97
MFRFIQKTPRKFCSSSQVFVLQNIYATKPSIRNQIKTDDFKSYENLGKVKKFVFRELHAGETGLGPIPSIDEGAKIGDYKNPEYYSYHNYSYYDFELGIQCMHLPQPSSIAEEDLLTMMRKNCIGEEEDHSGRCCPPPRCSVECMKESATDGEDGGAPGATSKKEKGPCYQSNIETTIGHCTTAEAEVKKPRDENESSKEPGPVCGKSKTEDTKSVSCGKSDT